MAQIAIGAGGLAIGYMACKSFLQGEGDSIAGRICLITGAGSGVGREAAIQFAQAGCIPILWDISEQGLRDTVKAVAVVSDVTCFTQIVDVSDRFAVYAGAERAKEWAAPAHVSILVNNAGIVAGKTLLGTSDERILRTFEVNTLAHFWMAKAFIPDMIQHKQGHIATVASAAGLTAAASMVPYCASKHAAVGLAHGIRKELSALGHSYISTSLICPAHIQTKLFEGFKQPLMPSLSPEYVAETIVASVRRKILYSVMPTIFDPAPLNFLFPIWLQDKIESLLGLDSMMSNVKLPDNLPSKVPSKL